MNIKEIIAITFAYYNPGQVLDSAVLEIYAEDLADIDPQAVWAAYTTYRRNPNNNFFPLPAKIREIVFPENYISPEDQAVEVAARICAAVPKFGWNNARDAAAFIGDVGWGVVQRQGGWSYLCENLGTRINPSTFQAQVRKQIETTFKYGSETVEQAIGAKSIHGRCGDLLPFGEVLKLIDSRKIDLDPEAS